ncbi:MAG: hypothetical protein IKF83_04380 [Clostridia bacterium]|nr:hypothetical protein [Clostridia bacterium]
MDKVLVKLYIPIIEKQYDIKIPLSRKIGDAILLIIKGINEINMDIYTPKESPLLYNKNTGMYYDYNATIRDTDIKNGTELILI